MTDSPSRSYQVNGTRVTGLNEFTRALRKAGVALGDLRTVMKRVSSEVASAAEPLAVRVSGDMASTIRAAGTKTKAIVRAGSARVPYTGARHYGWPARGIDPNPFLLEGLDKKQTRIHQVFDQAIDNILEGKKP